MDYSYFNNAPQAYQFLGLPPTPGHTGSAVSSEEFSNSPPVRAPSFHYLPTSQITTHHPTHPQSQEFHQNPTPHYSHSHSQSHSHPPSPLQYSPHHHSPPTTAFLTPRQHQQDAFDQFQNFDTTAFNSTNFNNATTSTNGLPKPPTPLSQHEASIGSNGNNYELSNGSATNMDANDESMRRGQSNSDDDDMTPAQSRRKAQNRAAQRAFRERKERHVKDLEAKLSALESTSKNITEENARLKLQLQRAATENEILKATSSPHHNSYRSHSPPTTSGPLRYNPTDFYTEVLHAHENKIPSHRIVVSEGGERLLAAGAAWDYIIKHPLFKRGLVDVGNVSERLKGAARCDGQGPVFEERAIIEAIEKSVASGSDELL